MPYRMTMSFWEPRVEIKLAILEKSVHEALLNRLEISDRDQCQRDIQVLKPEHHPVKLGLSLKEGQARLLHDLANIELQAMELGLKTLLDYPDAPHQFREELAAITLQEGEHLKLCLDGIQALGFRWGDWPIHNILWNANSSKDLLLDRILIVHRYLEGSGLDAGETLMSRLHGVPKSCIHSITKRIFEDEIPHVEFGSRWYRTICIGNQLDPDLDFCERMRRLDGQLPKRIEKIQRKPRLRAGFNIQELEYLEERRLRLIAESRKATKFSELIRN